MKPTIASIFILLSGIVSGGATALAAPANHETFKPAAHPDRSAQILPAALRPVLYKALFEDAGRSIQIGNDGCITLSEQSLKACFDKQGVHFSGGSSLLTLHLAAYGRGGKLSPVTAVRPKASSNQVSYDHGHLTEWWRALPVGLEQGFTITKRPNGHGKLELALSANWEGAGAASISHSGAGRNPAKNTLVWGRLRYGKLVVTDATGKVVPATLTNKGDHVLIAVNDTHAVYPLLVDPLVWLEQKVANNDDIDYGYFGAHVALEGNTAFVTVIGYPNDTWQGAVYVFQKADGKWVQTQKLTSSDGVAHDQFGCTIALDGRTAIIGAFTHPYNSGLGPGAAYVFTESDGVWTQTQELTASDGMPGDEFGDAIAVNGATAIISAPNADTENGTGAVYVFTRTDGVWSETQKLIAGDSAAGGFGDEVALDDTTALVGRVDFSQSEGEVYAFEKDQNGNWSETQEIASPQAGTSDYFGEAIAVKDGIALIGAPGTTVDDTYGVGAVYEFTESGGIWNQSQELVAGNGSQYDYFGTDLSMSGNSALVVAEGFNSHQGAAYLFNDANGTWGLVDTLTPSDWDGFSNIAFGSGAALSGTTALVGAYLAPASGSSIGGAVYFYDSSDLDLALSAPQTVGQGQSYVSQAIATNNASAASPAVSATITVPAAASFVSATASQGTCGETSGVVTCDFGQIGGNAGTAAANVTLKATGNVGDTIDNTASVAKATPVLSAGAPTTITAGGACPEGYTEYDGTLNPGEVARSPVYQAPSGQENAILTAPAGFELYAVYQSGRFGRHVYRVPGNEVHRWGPKGLYMWLVRAHDGAGAYTLCLQHP